MRRAAKPNQPGVREQRSPAAAPGRQVSPRAAQALGLQRTAGNRATARLLARWAKHPDEEKKGVMVPDVVSSEFLKLNPPTNK